MKIADDMVQLLWSQKYQMTQDKNDNNKLTNNTLLHEVKEKHWVRDGDTI